MADRILSRSQCRQVDDRAMREIGLSGLVLMENAGRGVVEVLARLGIDGPVAICCGKGNNAGDGFVMARHLDNRGIPTSVLLLSDPDDLVGDARTNYAILRRAGVTIRPLATERALADLPELLAGACWIVDALLGTGARGEPRPPWDQAIDAMNAAPARKLALDVPSGLDCDTGRPARHTFEADHTCSFVAAKPGFQHAGADRYTGQVHVVDIGVPRRLVDEIGNWQPETGG